MRWEENAEGRTSNKKDVLIFRLKQNLKHRYFASDGEIPICHSVNTAV